MDEIISYKMCAVKVRNAKLRNYLNMYLSVFENAKIMRSNCAVYIVIYYLFRNYQGNHTKFICVNFFS
jgi:hypothetical protein